MLRILNVKFNWIHHRTIRSIAEVKKASAITNFEVGVIEENISNAIIKACDEIIEGNVVPFIPDYVSELSDYYLSKGDTLYISKYPSEGDFKWYLPEINKQKMDF